MAKTTQINIFNEVSETIQIDLTKIKQTNKQLSSARHVAHVAEGLYSMQSPL